MFAVEKNKMQTVISVQDEKLCDPIMKVNLYLCDTEDGFWFKKKASLHCTQENNAHPQHSYFNIDKKLTQLRFYILLYFNVRRATGLLVFLYYFNATLDK